MRKLRWQFVVVVLALIAIGALLLTQQQTLLPGIETVDEPASGGVYTEALVGSPGRWNPLLDTYNSVDYDVDRLIYSSLMRFDHRGLPYFDLAQDMGISQDGKRYSFAIRPEAVWHDGEPVTSEDIIFTVELMQNEAIPLPDDLKDFWGQVSILAINDKTLQFTLPEPFAPFLDYLTFGVLPRHLLQDVALQDLADAAFNLKPVGSGPFRFESLIVEDEKIAGLVLAAFQDYYREKPFIEKVVFRYFPDSASALAAYQQGEVVGISKITPDVLPQALKEAGLNLFTGRLPRLGLVYLNLANPKTPFFQDVAVRRALLMGINRRWIVDRIFGGQAILADGPIFPESWAYYEGVERVPFDLDAAVTMLKEAGYTIPAEGGGVRSKEGIALAFEMAYPDEEIYTDIAEQIRRDWAKLGVEVRLMPVPYEELLADYLDPRTYEAALVELNLGRSPDPDPYPFWHQAQITGGQNYSQWDDRQVSEYLEQARVIDDLDERARRYRNFQVRFSAELPALPLFYPVYSFGLDKQINGASMGPLYDPSDRFTTIASWYLITGPAAAQALTTSTAIP
ncbi:MAG: peptide ABC transporter substrate-binding protein [Anaerolineales bacterium]|nr:peptide ABC transporter substrate-binding protein [Anaerolineales bacterium]